MDKMMFRPVDQDLFDRIDDLEQMYRAGYDECTDIKFLHGVEKCIELRMKMLGYDGKTLTAAPVEAENVIAIDLKQLSDQALKEIVGLTDGDQ